MYVFEGTQSSFLDNKCNIYYLNKETIVIQSKYYMHLSNEHEYVRYVFDMEESKLSSEASQVCRTLSGGRRQLKTV